MICKLVKQFRIKNKQIMASVLSLSLIVGMVPFATLTANALSEAPGKDDDGYYLIGTVDELTWFANEVNGGKLDINAKLISDIDFGTDNTANWVPMGTKDQKYGGIFDGENHTIKNLYYSDLSNKYTGFLDI